MNRKVALITGASSGIGRALAEIHASRGLDLVIVSRKEADLLRVKEELEVRYGTTVDYIAADLTDPSAPKAIYDEVQLRGIVVEYLVNNAGFGGRGYFHKRDWADDRGMMAVNMVALTALTRLFLPDFVARGHGRVLNVASTAALLPGPMQAVYYATKAYVHSFSLAIAGELFGTGVTVTALLPGATNSNFAKTSDMGNTLLFKKAVPAMQVARAGYIGMMRGKLQVIAGLPLPLRATMNLTPFLPKRLVLHAVKRSQQIDPKKERP